mmetsp:Transcript_907/g.2649  ORF Transcript_907/g.2649 Transcript_907/m.2649 type:complete len:237 (-) Transcript_907:53-763(-)
MTSVASRAAAQPAAKRQRKSLAEMAASVAGPPSLVLPPALEPRCSSSSLLSREINPEATLPALLRIGAWGTSSGAQQHGSFRSVAMVRGGGSWMAHSGCELKVERIVSQRRHHRCGVGSIAALAGSFAFARGDIRIEQQPASFVRGVALPPHVAISVLDGHDDASVCGEGEGALEPEEMRLLACLIPPGQTLALRAGGRGSPAALTTEPGDIELHTAFRPATSPSARVLLRWEADD